MTSSASYDTIKLYFLPWLFDMNALPNLQQLLLCRAHLKNCTRAYPHRKHTHGYLYFALPPQLYALETPAAYTARAADPASTVTYTNNVGDIARRNIDNKFNLSSKEFHDKRTVNHALNERLYVMLGQYAKDVRNKAKGIGNPTFLQV